MKYRRVLWTALPFLVLLCPQTCLHASDSADKTAKAVEALDSERANAFIHEDFGALDRLLGNDLTFIHASGLLESKAELLADFKSGKRHYIAISNSDINVRVIDNVAIITAHSNVRVAHEGKESNLSLRVTEAYANRKGGWQLIAYQSTRIAP